MNRARMVYFFLILACWPSRAEILESEPLKARILYDYSGSMWAGYSLTNQVRGNEPLFHTTEPMHTCLSTLLERQGSFNVKQIEMHIFSSFPDRHLRKLVHSPIAPNYFNIQRALDDRDWGEVGKDTDLIGSLDSLSTGFEGIVWLITDNIVERGRETTVDFFKKLKSTERYRAVHIFKYPMRQSGQGNNNLAIYGIVVSPESVSDETLDWLDGRFNELGNVFPERQFIKLKELRVGATGIDIQPIEVKVDIDRKKVVEGHSIKLPLSGRAKSKLTHHTITGGALVFSIDGAFSKEKSNTIEVPDLSAGSFKSVRLDIDQKIPPDGEWSFAGHLISTESIPIEVKGLVNKLKVAWSGGRATYTGTCRVNGELNVAVQAEGNRRIQGLFDIDKVDEIFDQTDDVNALKTSTQTFPVHFTVTTKDSRGWLLVAIVAPLLITLWALGFLLLRRHPFKVCAGREEILLSPSMLSPQSLVFKGLLLGKLGAAFGGEPKFTPNDKTAGIRIETCKSGRHYQVVTDSLGAFDLTICRLGDEVDTHTDSEPRAPEATRAQKFDYSSSDYPLP